MNNLKIFLFFTLLLPFCFTTKKLQLYQLVTRHGDRSPLYPLPNIDTEWYCYLTQYQYPSDTFDDTIQLSRLYREKFPMNEQVLEGNCSIGQLTMQGFEQHKSVGSKLRNKLILETNFLQDTLDQSETYVRSTDIRRTLLSAQGLLEGLYPTSTPQQSDNIDVVTIHTIDDQTDNMYPNSDLCPRIAQLEEEIEKSDGYQNELKQMQDVTDELNSIFGTTDLGGLTLTQIYSTIVCYQSHGKTLPSGITESMINRLHKHHNWVLDYISGHPEYARVASVMFLKDLLESMLFKINNQNNYKFQLYSGHESTLYPLIKLLGIDTVTEIPYAGHLSFQLLKEYKKYFVRITFNDQVLTIPKCKLQDCPFNSFYKLAMELIPNSYSQICQTI
ncbi:lysophosphatidic acid phosphatase type 6 [Anaeramoeba flamelloides]|uniref:Lysophosphatidic acid phosphatase type 6 n=1 Tax=Anaeramoeba flamelloides TaxID=1746091 RepID=A0ABQ8YG83_9EUKA|nr:lysophosphatidic acid phosphatase type 6 [Anaeramoeba flamelloides]